ncbi:MAG: substrate-binding domain-containing protein [Gemmataceae bacterium]
MLHKSEEPKYLQVAQDLENRIRSGVWDDRKVPSLRVLASEHDVSIVTAARAIQVCCSKGLIRRKEHSRGYQTVPEGRASQEKWGLCLRVTSGEWQQLNSAVSRLGFETIAGEEGVAFQESFDLGQGVSRREMQEQIRRAKNDGVGGMFFLPSRSSDATAAQDEKFLELCGSENMPIVLLERNLRGHSRELEHDLVAVDDLDGGVRTTEHLLQIGRKRIAIVVASPTSSHDERVAGYLHQLRVAHLSGRSSADYEPIILQQPEGVTGKRCERWLADELLARQIDGVICYQDAFAIGLIVELFTRGVRIPDDIAVVGFDNLPIGDLFTVGVTTYAYPGEGIVRNALRLMRQRINHPAGRTVKVSVPGELIVRESSVPDKSQESK